jgi:hypothetical protein
MVGHNIYDEISLTLAGMHPAALRGSTFIHLNYFEKLYVFSAVKQYHSFILSNC